MTIPGATIIGMAVILGTVGIGQHWHPADRKPHERAAQIMPGMFDGPQLEREGGRRWLIMRTGGKWL